GYDPDTYPGRIGVFAGASLSQYALRVHASAAWKSVGDLQAIAGCDKDFLCTRVSYKLNLRGPSVSVQTACSTSLVAVHLACQSLQRRECDIALAGGVSAGVPQAIGYLYEPGGIYSPDGHCRPFDSRSSGTVSGSGLGIVVLRRLEEARAEGDSIEA